MRPIASVFMLAVTPAASWAVPDFVKDVQPILEANCIRCHGAAKDSGGLRLHDLAHATKGGETGPAFVAGKPDQSELLKRVQMEPSAEEFMPQKAQPLSQDQIAVLKAWITAGAKWPEGVKLKAKKGEKQIAEAKALADGPAPLSALEAAKRMDALIALENSHRENLPNAGPIDDSAYLRRVTVDLIGRIPTAADVAEFMSLSEPTRRADWMKKLLENERFADRWAVFFADMLRVRSDQPGGPQLQSFIHQSLVQKMPYDELARRLISAQGRPGQDPAVGWILGDNAMPFELAAATSQIFMGVRMACAECHDHPFDDWNQRDFYELASFFGQTKRVENRFARSIFTTEAPENIVMWPPERLKPEKREAVPAKFPFSLDLSETKPHWISRLEAKRLAKVSVAEKTAKAAAASLDDLLDVDTSAATKAKDEAPNVTADAKAAEINGINVSKLRQQLAAKITDPNNPYFARVLVNRVWAELTGHGFVEPLDNFSEYNHASHPASLRFLAQEFIASGYDLRSLLEIIVQTKTYQLAHLPNDVPLTQRLESERHFLAATTRPMLSEALFDSIVIAGHLTQEKWPAGANLRTVTRQIRVPVDSAAMKSASPNAAEAAMTMKPNAMKQNASGAGYDLEKSIAVDFKDILKQAEREELESMKETADAMIEQQRMMAQMQAEAAARERYEIKTIEEKIDDNPRYDSTFKMASPAAPDHFLRVFGQPSRERLGEFRDRNPSLRQQLLLINGHATHHASRVGPKEPIHALLINGKTAEAIKLAYIEILTRPPTDEEAAEAQTILTAASSPEEGMADLRWALLNCHEFRYLP